MQLTQGSSTTSATGRAWCQPLGLLELDQEQVHSDHK